MKPLRSFLRHPIRSTVIILVVLTAAALVFGLLRFRTQTLATFDHVQSRLKSRMIFLDVHNQPFYTETGTEDREYAALDRISPELRLAVVAIEDKRFYSHFGFDPFRLLAAAYSLFNSDAALQGASTITQQLVRATLLSPEVTLGRKLCEILAAVMLETAYSKDQILESYLNRIYLGHGRYGVEKAARQYFDKSARDLNLAESALVAGLIKKPEAFSPFVDPELAERRRRTVLKVLHDLGWITGKAHEAAIHAVPSVQPFRPRAAPPAPYFVQQVRRALKQRLDDRPPPGGERRIHTTLDPALQAAMERVISERLSRPRSFEEAAGVSLDPATGEVRALVGGVDFSRSQFNRATQARRQPGSAFKPILYATALTRGIRPNDVFWDEPTRYTRIHDGQPETYQPRNFDGQHHGPMTVAHALRTSNNVVSVKILDRIGIPALVTFSRRFGIDLPEERGWCLALGCGEVSLLDLASAYGVFADQGIRRMPVFIRSITDPGGNRIGMSHKPETDKRVSSIEKQALDSTGDGGKPVGTLSVRGSADHENAVDRPSSGQSVRVLDEVVAFQIHYLLRYVVNTGTGRNARIGRPAFGKTGTSDRNRDAWFIGYTPSLVTGFWIGNDDNRPMDDEVGGDTPARLWQAFMNAVPASAPEGGALINPDLEEYRLCDSSGKLTTRTCPNTSWYALPVSQAPTEPCDWHQ